MKQNIQKNHKSFYRKQQVCPLSVVSRTLCVIISLTVLFSNFYVSAHNNRTEEPVNFKYYKSITIESGDCLWTIAEEYITDDYSSVSEYVEVLKEINHIHGDHIQEGQSLIVAYNDKTFKK